MRCWSVGDELLERDAVGACDVDGLDHRLRTRRLPEEEIWSEANQTHGYGTLVVPRELVRTECERHKHEHGGHGDDELER